MAKTAEVATPFSEMRPYEQALAEIKGRTDHDQDSFQIAASVADRIAQATSLEEILAIPEQGPGSLEDYVGRAFHLVKGSVRWSNAAEQFREGGTGFYVIFRISDLSGNEHLLSTGSVNIVFQVRQMEKLGIFDGEGLTSETFTVKTRPVPSGTLFWLGSA